MLDSVTIILNKNDLQKSIADLKSDQKMIDLPIFASLRTAIEMRLAENPNLVMKDLSFETNEPNSESNFLQAVVYFEPDSNV